MIFILDQFKPHSRMLPNANGNLVKTGTLTGVYSYAGYFQDNDQQHSFVLILNQNKNNRSAVLNYLEKLFNQARQ